MDSKAKLYYRGRRARTKFEHIDRAGMACKKALERHPDSEPLQRKLKELRVEYTAAKVELDDAIKAWKEAKST